MTKLKYKPKQQLFTYYWAGGETDFANIYPCTVVRAAPFITSFHDYIVRFTDGSDKMKSESELFKTADEARQGLIAHIYSRISDWHDGIAQHARDILKLHGWIDAASTVIDTLEKELNHEQAQIRNRR